MNAKNSSSLKVAIVGGGAAGFFAAFSVKEHHKDAQVVIFEKSNKILAKVKISGGGRCNVTNACFSASKLSKFYPRGEKEMKRRSRFFRQKTLLSGLQNEVSVSRPNQITGCFP